MPKEVDVHLDPVADGRPSPSLTDYVFPAGMALAGLWLVGSGDLSHGLTLVLFGGYAYVMEQLRTQAWTAGYFTGAESASEQVAEQVGAEKR